jgi:hypothetical protein
MSIERAEGQPEVAPYFTPEEKERLRKTVLVGPILGKLSPDRAYNLKEQTITFQAAEERSLRRLLGGLLISE